MIKREIEGIDRNGMVSRVGSSIMPHGFLLSRDSKKLYLRCFWE